MMIILLLYYYDDIYYYFITMMMNLPFLNSLDDSGSANTVFPFDFS